MIALVGLTYALKPSFMPYHAAALEMQWTEVPENFQVLIIALMRAFGGACIALSCCVFVILWTSFSKGARWAHWCIPLVLCLASLGGLYAMSHVMIYTQATPPWKLSGGILVFSLAGFILAKPSQTMP